MRVKELEHKRHLISVYGTDHALFDSAGIFRAARKSCCGITEPHSYTWNIDEVTCKRCLKHSGARGK